MGYRVINGRAVSVGNIADINPQNTQVKLNKNKPDISFKEVLDKVSKVDNGYKVSKHAEERLKDLNFSESDMQNIQQGFKLAENKGAKNSLLLYKDVALITSIENKTIITAVDKNRAQDNVFTNIDSVVIL